MLEVTDVYPVEGNGETVDIGKGKRKRTLNCTKV